MKRQSMFVLVVAVAALLLSTIVASPPNLLSTVNAQTTAQLGTTSERAEDSEGIFDRAEDFDKDSIEANPVADDDSIGETAAKVHPIPVPLPGGLDHVANGVGTRNAGFGTIRLRGVPRGAVAVRAFLYWGTVYDGNAIPLTARATFNGRHVLGRLIGVSRPPCWPGSFFAAYRAGVIALLRPGINSDYSVTNLPSSLTDGRDPWLHAPVPPPRPLSEGASLLVVYAHNDVPVRSRISLNEGATMFFGSVDIHVPLNRPLPPYNVLKHTRIGADGQVGASTFAQLFATDERTFLGPISAALTQIKGPGSSFNGDSDWNGGDGGPQNQLWDTQTSSFTENLITPGASRYLVRYVSHGDCIVAIVHVLGVH